MLLTFQYHGTKLYYHTMNGSLLPALGRHSHFPCWQVEDPALKAEYLHMLTEREREYVESVSQPAVARERLLARVLERTTLARCGLCRGMRISLLCVKD
jgi:hypothetical protein